MIVWMSQYLHKYELQPDILHIEVSHCVSDIPSSLYRRGKQYISIYNKRSYHHESTSSRRPRSGFWFSFFAAVVVVVVLLLCLLLISSVSNSISCLHYIAISSPNVLIYIYRSNSCINPINTHSIPHIHKDTPKIQDSAGFLPMDF